MIKTLQANGHEFTYIEAGFGPPLVFVHGSLLDYRYWQNEVAYFADNFHAIAPSRRHHWPTPPKGEFSYTGGEQTDDVLAFIEALGRGRFILLATPMADTSPHVLRAYAPIYCCR